MKKMEILGNGNNNLVRQELQNKLKKKWIKTEVKSSLNANP